MAEAKSSRDSASSSSSKSRASKTRSTKGVSKGRSTARSPRGGSAKRSRGSGRKSQKTRARHETRKPSTRSTNGHSRLESVGDSVSSGAENAAQGVAGVVKKAKGPLIASGVVVAGLAGGAVLKGRTSRRKVLGVTMPRGKRLKNIEARTIPGAVSNAAKRADRFGQRVSSVANSVQTVSETADKAMKKA